MILPNNLRKNSTIPIKQRSSFFQSFASVKRFFPFYSNAVITFETVFIGTLNDSVFFFLTLAPAIRAPAI